GEPGPLRSWWACRTTRPEASRPAPSTGSGRTGGGEGHGSGDQPLVALNGVLNVLELAHLAAHREVDGDDVDAEVLGQIRVLGDVRLRQRAQLRLLGGRDGLDGATGAAGASE